ncbi:MULTISPECIES: hypothetical protein [unclassified Mesorhizobium]|uniref:hypothetical protein n=1 Tax=unclassified Mesorhizobium TaxID=325217 RepID=UPI0026AD89E2
MTALSTALCTASRHTETETERIQRPEHRPDTELKKNKKQNLNPSALEGRKVQKKASGQELSIESGLHAQRLSASYGSSRLSEQLGRCLDLVGGLFDPIEAHQHATLEHRQPRSMVKLAALATVRIQRLEQHRHANKRRPATFVPTVPSLASFVETA